jgi:serine/threonine protein kinase
MTTILPLEAGATVGGHYSIGGLINTGGFGSVYRGIALSDGNRPCAIKETYDVTPAARRQALMEAAVLFTIKSDHLPQVYDAFEENGRFYLAMQLIEGQNCSQMVRTHGGAFSEQEVLGWLLPIADVLQELHGRNPPVLHRDIKPANIILMPQGRAVLVDFGLTRLYDPAVETQTLARAVSEGFSPLEQYVGKTSPRSDVYALAATMYFLLTAQAPPASVARSMQDKLVPPRQLNPQISPKVENILLKALEVNAEQRYASMQEFANALRAPGFAAYADPTISQSAYQGNVRTEMALGPSPPLTPSAPTWQQQGLQGQRTPRQSVQHQVSQAGFATSEPIAGWSMPPLPAQPIRHAGRYIPPPAGGSLPMTSYPPVAKRTLPSSFNQGCLWGLLQGVLSALIVLLLHQQIYFYLALGEGFLFYVLAGFFTTRYGGPVRRAWLAGIWAGVISTISFWIVLLIGIVILALRKVDVAHREGIRMTFNQAVDLVKPTFLVGSSTANTNAHQDSNGLPVFLVIGLACAVGFAWLGGVLGRKSASRKLDNRGNIY